MMNNKIILVLLLIATSAAGEEIKVAVQADFTDGTDHTRCLEIDEGSSAYDAVSKAGGFKMKHYGFGHAICKIKQEGCPTSNCFCGGSDFWNFWVNAGMAPVGIDDYRLEDGDVIAFTWGGWGANPPKEMEFTDICMEDATGKWTPRKIKSNLTNQLTVNETASIYVYRRGKPDYPEPRVKVDIVALEEAGQWRAKDRLNKAEKIMTAVADFAGKISITPPVTGNYMMFMYKDGVEPVNKTITVSKKTTTTTTPTTTTTTTTRIEWVGPPVKTRSWWMPGWYDY